MFGVVVSDYGPTALLGITVLAVILGGLLPRWTHNRFMKFQEDRLKEKDELIGKLTAALDKRDEQFDIVIRQGELTVRLLEDIKAAGQKQGVSSQ
jgi:hypothetical protein